MHIEDLLPVLPYEGPPFPRFLGITWGLEGAAIAASALSLALSLIVAGPPPGVSQASSLRRKP